jgi:hypothetical protein
LGPPRAVRLLAVEARLSLPRHDGSPADERLLPLLCGCACAWSSHCGLAADWGGLAADWEGSAHLLSSTPMLPPAAASFTSQFLIAVISASLAPCTSLFSIAVISASFAAWTLMRYWTANSLVAGGAFGRLLSLFFGLSAAWASHGCVRVCVCVCVCVCVS